MRTPRVLLSSASLRDYRSCQSTSLSLGPRITALIGPNGSGKTNVMQGLMLLCASRRRVDRGEEDDVFRAKSHVNAAFRVGKRAIDLRASITYRPTDQNRDEVLYSEEKWNFRAITGKDEWITLPPFRDLERYVVRFSSSSPSRPRNLMFPFFRGGRPDTIEIQPAVWRAMVEINDFRSRTVYYSASQFTNPAMCPPSFEVDQEGDLTSPVQTGTRQREHLNFLHQLYRMFKTRESLYSTYLSLVDGYGLGLIQKIKWRETKFSTKRFKVKVGGRVIAKKLNRLLIVPTVQIGGSQLSFAQLSEGTFRSLAILFYVVTDRSQLLLIEEPEVCVHRGLLNSLIDVIREFSVQKQIIFSTHSETVLDKLDPELVRLVSKRESGTKVQPISKTFSARQFKALKLYLENEGNLGEYWRHSGFQE